MLKEIYEVATLKTTDGTFLNKIWEMKIKYKELDEKQLKFQQMRK